MAAYAVFIRESMKDKAEMDMYSSMAGATLDGHQAKVLAAYGPQKVLEGPEVEGVVIVEFPSIETAKLWYESPAYREAREHPFQRSGISGRHC